MHTYTCSNLNKKVRSVFFFLHFHAGVFIMTGKIDPTKPILRKPANFWPVKPSHVVQCGLKFL